MTSANKQPKPTAVFFGTPRIAAAILDHLIENEITEIKAVVTNPDKPAGRGKQPKESAVSIVARQRNLEVLKPETANNAELRDTIAYLRPDLFIVVAYGHIVPNEILNYAAKGGLNVHPSLLPRYRGPNPIAAVIDAGEKKTGVSIMLMDEQMDHGPILAQSTTTIKDDETTESLSERLTQRGATLLAKTLPQWMDSAITPKEQNHEEATYTTLLTKHDGQIDWSEPAAIIERHVRALYPWPSAWTTLPNGKRMSILKARAHHPRSLADEDVEEGVIQIYNNSPAVRTGDGLLELQAVRIEGKQTISSEDFLNGYATLVGSRFSY